MRYFFFDSVNILIIYHSSLQPSIGEPEVPEFPRNPIIPQHDLLDGYPLLS